MKNWTIGRRLAFGFAALIAITVCLGGYAFMSLSRISGMSVVIEQQALPGVIKIDTCQKLTTEAYGLVLRFILASSAAERKDIERQMTEAANTIDTLFKEYEKTITRDVDRRLYDAVGPIRAEYRDIRADLVFPLALAGQTAEATAAAETELLPVYTRYVRAMQEMVDENERYANAQSAQIRSESAKARFIAMIACVLALVLGVGIAWLIVRSTNAILTASVTELMNSGETCTP